MCFTPPVLGWHRWASAGRVEGAEEGFLGRVGHRVSPQAGELPGLPQPGTQCLGLGCEGPRAVSVPCPAPCPSRRVAPPAPNPDSSPAAPQGRSLTPPRAAGELRGRTAPAARRGPACERQTPRGRRGPCHGARPAPPRAARGRDPLRCGGRRRPGRAVPAVPPP